MNIEEKKGTIKCDLFAKKIKKKNRKVRIENSNFF